MAVSDWNRIHASLEVYYGNTEYGDTIVYPSPITRLNEKVMVLGKSGGDTTWCPYQLDEYSYGKIADLSTWSGELTYVGGMLFFNNRIFVAGGYLAGGSFGENNCYLFMVESGGNKYKVIDVRAGIGVPAPPDNDYWTCLFPKIGMVAGKLYFLFTYSKVHQGTNMHHFLYSSPDGTNWFLELDYAVPGNQLFNSDPQGNFVAPGGPRRGIALFNNKINITTEECHGFVKTASSTWTKEAGLTPATHRYDRMFMPFNYTSLHSAAGGFQVERTTNFTDSTLFLPTTGATNLKSLGIYSGTWWVSDRSQFTDTNMTWYWDAPDTAWALDADFQFVGATAGKGFLLGNIMGRLWGIPTGYAGGIWYRDKLGLGFGRGSERRSNKLSIGREEEKVYVSTYTSMDTPDFWRVDTDLTDVELITQSTISGSPGLVQSYYDDHIILGGVFFDSLLKYSDDQFTTWTLIDVPSGVAWATAVEQLLDSTDLANLFVATYSGADAHYAMNYSTTSGLYSVGDLPFWMLGTCREDMDIFGGQGDVDNPSIVEYTFTRGVSFEQRDTGLPNLIITDMEFDS